VTLTLTSFGVVVISGIRSAPGPNV